MSSPANIVQFPDLKTIEGEAAQWVARFDARGKLSAHEVSGLREWVAQSTQHRETLDRMAALWGGLDILDEINYCEPPEISTMKSRFMASNWLKTGAVAAMLLVGIMTAYVGFDGGVEGLRQSGHYYTDVGQQRTVALSDGSEIILNTNSEVEVDYSPNSRVIRLIKGEAHFDVAKDTERPFLVHAHGGIVKAVGTAFTVFVREKDVEVTVSEGVVALLSPHAPEAVKTQEFAEASPLAALTAGQNAVFAQKTVERVTRMSAEALDRKLLWRGGFIAFAGEPLSEVVADVSRYTDMHIEINDPALESLPIGGYFKVGEVEGMFEALEGGFGVEVERVSATHVRLTRAS